MRIQSINNCNFEGQYITKSKGSKWWVEYMPYSWENYNHSTAEPITFINLLSPTLPNNEQISKSVYKQNVLQKEVTSDIFGKTTSIYNAVEETRHNDIRELPSMNRERSIQVYIDKLEMFLKMKEDYQKDVEHQLQETYNQIRELSDVFDQHSKDYDSGFLVSKNTNRENKDLMTQAKEKIMDRIESEKKQQEHLKQLNKSMDSVKKQIIELRKELEIIRKAKNTGKIIDISVRTVFDADRPLWNALKDMRSANDKIIVLPHRTISMRKIIAQMNQDKLPISKNNIVKHITKLIDFIR